MKQKLNCILLIDDDEPTNFLHKMVIDEANCTEKTAVMENGQDALDYLRSKQDGKYPQPDLIFLDINMPAMDGWEFLEYYKHLNLSQQGEVVVVMLTTSLNPDDLAKAKGIKEISCLRNKPLTIDMLQELLDRYFAD